MNHATLSETLTALGLGVDPGHDMLAVEEAEIRLPMLVRMQPGPDGPVFCAQPPWSAFRAGFEPQAHRMVLRFAQVPNPDFTAPAQPSTPPGAAEVPATRPDPDGTG